jgi:hypothetical protein
MDFFIFIFWVQTNEQPNKKTIQRVVFHFPKQFFPQAFSSISFDPRKKLIKNENLIQSGKFFPHSNFYWKKEKGKYGKCVRFHMQFWGRGVFVLTTETSLEKAWKSSFLIDH